MKNTPLCEVLPAIRVSSTIRTEIEAEAAALGLRRQDVVRLAIASYLRRKRPEENGVEKTE